MYDVTLRKNTHTAAQFLAKLVSLKVLVSFSFSYSFYVTLSICVNSCTTEVIIHWLENSDDATIHNTFSCNVHTRRIGYY